MQYSEVTCNSGGGVKTLEKSIRGKTMYQIGYCSICIESDC